MQGRVTQIQRFSVHDGPGIRTTVFMKGCNLRCIWCHNPETYSTRVEVEYFRNRCVLCGRCVQACPSGARSMLSDGIAYDKTRCNACFRCENACVHGALTLCGTDYSEESLCAELRKDQKYYAKSGGGVTFSGGEPLLQSAFVFACAERLHAEGISCAVETASCVPEEVMREAIPRFDLFMCDLKAMDPTLHRTLTGVENGRILENLRLLAKSGSNVLIRIPVAMGLNGTEENMIATASFMKQNGLHQLELLKLHKLSEHKYDALTLPHTHPDVPETTDADIARFYEIFQSILGKDVLRKSV